MLIELFEEVLNGSKYERWSKNIKEGKIGTIKAGQTFTIEGELILK